MNIPTIPVHRGMIATDPVNDPVLADVVVDVDWSAMTAGDQRAFYAEKGFLVVPRAIADPDLASILADAEGSGWPAKNENIWECQACVDLIDNEPVTLALEAVLGPTIRFFKGVYVGTPPRDQVPDQPFRQAFHVDYGIGEDIADMRNSCASWINVAWYLSALAPEHAPLWVVPGSHNMRHLVPTTDMEHLAKDAQLILTEPGDAILWGGETVHAGGYNDSSRPRHALFYSYRPAWARPAGTVDEWPAELLQKCTPRQRRMLGGLNRGIAGT